MLQYKQQVAELIFKVVAKTMCVRDALLAFPKCADPSINCAYLALAHLEADEDIRARDALYAKEQDEYIEMIANTLFKGEAIPLNIIAQYQEYYPSIVLNEEGFINNILRAINL